MSWAQTLAKTDRDALRGVVCECGGKKCLHDQARAEATSSDVAAAFLTLEIRLGRVRYGPPERAKFLPAVADGYKALLADPPWPERGGGKVKRGADRHYDLQEIRWIAELPVQTLCHAAGCHLWIWATNSHLEAAFMVLRAWGFRYINLRTWFKGTTIPEAADQSWEEIAPEDIEMEAPGLGQYVRGQTEHLLLGVRGALPYRTRADGKRAQVGTAILAPKTKTHSEKPPGVYEDVELVSHGPYAELFAREQRAGWSAWGNHQGLKSDIRLIVPPPPPPRGQISLL